jgi:AraC family transcriptional regulator, transcriptional activator of pobA
MKAKFSAHAPSDNPGFAALLKTCRQLAFEPHDIAGQLDPKGRYEVKLDREFPFLIKLFHYTSRRHTRGQTWHERLEIFTPLDGPTRFQMGDEEVQLARGELLVVDNRKLHQVVDFPDFNTRVVVISFLPDFVYTLGSPSFDYGFLLPFYSKVEQQPHIMRASDPASSPGFAAMARLLDCYFEEQDRHFFQAGCKAFLLELLFYMARYFRSSELLKWQFVRQQQRSLMLKKLFDHISAHYMEKLNITQAATLSGMSKTKFMKTFKKVSGTTLVAYLNHLRLTNAARLLKEMDASIAEIALQVGFSDQSHFDKRFKRSFGVSPKDYRAGKQSGGPVTAA